MLTVTIPDQLTSKINEFAAHLYQTPEDFIIELLAERMEHDSAYSETAYLAKSNANKKRLDTAIAEIRLGKYETHGLIDENN